MFIDKENPYTQLSLPAIFDQTENIYSQSFAVTYAKCLGELLAEHTPENPNASEWIEYFLGSLDWFSQNERSTYLQELIYNEYGLITHEYFALESLAFAIQSNPALKRKLTSENQGIALKGYLSNLFERYMEQLVRVKNTKEETEGKSVSSTRVLNCYRRYLKGKAYREDFDPILSNLILFFAKDLKIL